MKTILEKLFAQQTLSETEACTVMQEIGTGKVNAAQCAAFMTVFRMREISLQELAGFRNALLNMAITVQLETENATDMCGTGGDGRNTFNISTLSGFVVAGAGGRVIKHGNYGVSSVSGSSTVLEKLGYKFTNDNSSLARSLERSGICFLHAPLFHPALKNVAETRKSLGARTFFNMLGPLVNPARPSHRVTGLYSAELLRKYRYLLEKTNEKFALVYSQDGCDEISLTSPVQLSMNDALYVYSPRELGLSYANENDLSAGNSADEAAKIFVRIISGEGSDAQNNVVSANAGVALFNLGIEKTLTEAIARAKESLESGKALRAFKRFIDQPVRIK